MGIQASPKVTTPVRVGEPCLEQALEDALK